MPWRSVLATALAVGPLLVALALAFGHDPHAVPSVLEGKAAPLFTLPSLGGEPVSLEALRGRPVVVNFWSTWCLPCRSEHPLLQEAATTYAGRAHFLGIVYQDAPEAARAYLQQAGSVYPQLLDANALVSIDFGVAGVPESFILDAQGNIAYKSAGILSPAVLARELDRLMPADVVLDPGSEVDG